MAIETASSSTGISLSTDDKASPIPIVQFDRITIDSKDRETSALGSVTSSLVINLDMNIGILLSNALFSPNTDVMDHLSVCIVRSASKKVSSKIEAGADILEMLGSRRTGKRFIKKIYSGPLKNIFNRNASGGLNITQSHSAPTIDPESEKQIMKVSFQKNDILKNSEKIPHLSYYAFCFLDLESLAESLGIANIPNFMPTSGPVAGERVISNGRVKTTSHVFYVTSPFPKELNGTFWTGPVMKNAKDKYFSARWARRKVDKRGAIKSYLVSSSPPLDLEKIEVENTKIQDFRLLREIPSFNVDMRPSNFSPITIEGKDNFNNTIENPDTYISNAFLTRDMKNQCMFIFEFDYENTLIKESKFGKILTNPFVSKKTKQKINLYSKITNLQITRRQVDAARSYNKLSSVTLGISRSELDPETQIIVETFSDQSNNNTLKKMKSYAPGKARVGSKRKKLIGSIMELPAVKNSPRQTKTIAVTDASITELTDGTYQYGVKIQMEDGSIRFLNERLKRLETIRDYLVGYYNVVQIPPKSYQAINSVKEYYDLIFSRRKPRGSRNRANIAEKTEINALRREMGMLVGNLKASETLYPWIIAPTYIVDTLESISDFSYSSKPKRIQETPSLQTAPARLESDTGKSANVEIPSSPSEKRLYAGPTSAPSIYETEMGNAMVSTRSILGTEIDSSSTGKKSTPSMSTPTSSIEAGIRSTAEFSTKPIDLFDEDAALFAIRSLLNPVTASSESILAVINTLDGLVQKIRDMMGSSAEIEMPNTSVRQRGTARNSKVSVIELEDHFVELFDAKLSTFPSMDYIGFAFNPPGFPSVSGGSGGQISYLAGSDTEMLDVEDAESEDAPIGANALTADDWEIRTSDEEEMAADAAEEAATITSAGTGASTPPSVVDPNLQDNDTASSSKGENFALDEAASAPPTESAREAKRRKIRERKEKRKKREEKKNSGATMSSVNDGPSGSQILTPAILDSKDGTFIERSVAFDGYNNTQQYVEMQNKIVSQSTGRAPTDKSTNQDNLNLIMGALNVQVSSAGTPMAVQTSLTKGQNKVSPSVPTSDIFGENDLQNADTSQTRGSGCIPGSDGGGGSETMELCKSENNAAPVFQGLANIMAANGQLDEVTPKSNASSARKSSGKFAEMNTRKKSLQERRRGGEFSSPRRNLSQGMAAEVSVFMGYEKDSAGNFMIKRPIFETPSKRQWSDILRKLKSKNNKFNVILCMVKRQEGGDTPSGLNIVATNTYFLITRDNASLLEDPSFAVNSSRKDGPPRKARSSAKGVRVEDIPVQAISSIKVGKK